MFITKSLKKHWRVVKSRPFGDDANRSREVILKTLRTRNISETVLLGNHNRMPINEATANPLHQVPLGRRSLACVQA